MPNIKIGCNGLIINDHQLLLGIRKNCNGAGLYGIPGGHLEYGEKLIEATRRELLEECGIYVTKLVFNSTLDQVRTDQHYIQVNFIVQEFEGEITNTEPDKCEGWKWFDLTNLPSNIFPPHLEIIRAYQQNQPYNYPTSFRV
jgi:8-oxo-dGTP diphosphatase